MVIINRLKMHKPVVKIEGPLHIIMYVEQKPKGKKT